MRAVGSWFALAFAQLGAAAIVLACAIASAIAAPNPVSGRRSRSDGGFQTAAAARHPDRCRQRQRAVREGRRRSHSARQPLQADDRGGGVQRDQAGPAQADRRIHRQHQCLATGGAPSRTSSMFIPIHSKVAVDDLLHGVIIQSGNDACIALAEGISGSENEFAEMMTKRAREIGLAKSTFGNSNGLPDPRQLMTARELAKLARHIIETYPEYYKYLRRARIHLEQDPPVQPQSAAGDEYRRGRAEDRLHQGGRLRSGRLGGAERLAPDRRGQRPEVARRSAPTRARSCSNGASTISSPACCSPTGQEIAEAKVYGGEKGHVPLVAGKAVRLMVPRGVAREDHRARGLYRPGAGAGPEGPEDRHAEGLARRFLVLEVPLQAAESVGTGSMPQRAFDAAAELVSAVPRRLPAAIAACRT